MRARIAAAWIALASSWIAFGVSSDASARETLVQAARIVSATGDTMLMRAGQIATPATRAEMIRSGDRLRTGARSSVELAFEDGMRMTLGPRTDLLIDEYFFESNRSRGFFALARGSLRTVSGLLGRTDPDAFRLSTPTATLGVRGTDFTTHQGICDADACDPQTAARLRVDVHEGRVVVDSRAGRVEVPAGKSVELAHAGEAPRIAPPRITSGSRAPLPITDTPGTNAMPPPYGGEPRTTADPPWMTRSPERSGDGSGTGSTRQIRPIDPGEFSRIGR